MFSHVTIGTFADDTAILTSHTNVVQASTTLQEYPHIFNPLNAELNPISYLLALLGAHHFLHVSRIRVKSLSLRQLMLYIWSTYS